MRSRRALGLLLAAMAGCHSLMALACGPSFLVGENYVPSVAYCPRIEAKHQPYCTRCFLEENGVYRYHSETLMTSASYSCASFFAYANQCRMLASDVARSECGGCIAKGWYYRSNTHACEEPSRGL
jgi:hypothetical protein